MLSTKKKWFAAAGALALAGGATMMAMGGAGMGDNNGRGSGPVIYVASQGLFYDSIVVADPLPPFGPFQLLEMGGPEGTLMTEFGPGDHGYVGGRWMEDFDGDGVFHYFSCPLLGPGRDEP